MLLAAQRLHQVECDMAYIFQLRCPRGIRRAWFAVQCGLAFFERNRRWSGRSHAKTHPFLRPRWRFGSNKYRCITSLAHPRRHFGCRYRFPIQMAPPLRGVDAEGWEIRCTVTVIDRSLFTFCFRGQVSG